ncbi:type III pantothenate kinase [Aurantiacibacter gangjinensis]|uniref:Type III pantothenate kinase n=1 Tax=Aurantiacibacter gangjinensis TaxID=502682 RepID=A0A0G9MQI0_9SPHN|nr:type III pantothenate kinase [Aurantiacibacter gangjinensis]APE28822.1 Pantothenate kinase type III, CoaX-like [Aurantiacibacter gangjinensis]KLE32970.1 pantothenate kinase [Aurantiacibacter gangjinensis]
MLLAIDVGNTNVVFALFEGSDIRARWRIATDGRRTGDEYATWLLQLLAMEGVERSAISRIIFASVVPRADHNLTVLAQKYFGITPIIAGQGAAEWGFEIDVEQPHTLGADRALNCIAAHALVGGDMIVVDFGTATKFEAVDFNGAYKGGIIAPGINLSLDALVGKTAKLPRIAIRAPETSSVIGRNTEDQMLIGVFWGYVAMMEGLIERMKAEIGRPVKVVATGGLAILFDQKTDIFDVIDADLTIRGLQILADRAGET